MADLTKKQILNIDLAVQDNNIVATKQTLSVQQITATSFLSGPSGTTSLGTVTTLPSGSQATITNTGTPSSAILNFGIPKGEPGVAAGNLTSAPTQTSNFIPSPNTYYPVDATSGVITVTLPTSVTGQTISIKKSDTGTNGVNITGTINGTTNSTLNLVLPQEGKVLIPDGNGGWNVYAGNLSLARLDSRYYNGTSNPIPDATTTTKGIIQLAGDLTGTAAAPILKTTGVVAATYGSASTVPVTAVDAKGRITAVNNQSIQITEAQVTNLQTDLGLKANLASPSFTGTPTVPTPVSSDNSTTIANTAFVTSAILAAASSYDDVKEYANFAAFPTTGRVDTIYLADDTGYLYRWSGSTYVMVGGANPADATTTSKGIIQLAGDLAGTAASPTVPALTNKVNRTGDTMTGILDILNKDIRFVTSDIPVDLTPIMTSNNAPTGIASANQEANTSNAAWNAFDKDNTTKWTTGNTTSGILRYDFGTGKIITQYNIRGPISGQATKGPKNWTFEGSYDGVNWSTLDTQSNSIGWGSAELRTYPITNVNGYKTYRLNITTNMGDVTNLSLSELNLIGKPMVAGIDGSGNAVFKNIYADTFLDKGSQVYNVKAYGVVGDGVTDDSNAIQAAIAQIPVGGYLYFPPGTYIVSKRLTPVSYQTWFGAGKGVTIIKGSVASDWTIYVANSSVPTERFSIRDLTIDVNNINAASGLGLYYSNNCIVERIEFKNVTTQGWHMKIGVTGSATESYLCDSNKIIDCDFDTHIGGLEMLLIFNAKNTDIIRPRFRNKNNTGPTLGLWQKCYNTRIIDGDFRDLKGVAIYYSVTVEHTIIANCYFENVGSAIGGANTSDNGNFGLIRAEDIKIISPIIIGGTNSLNGTGIQLGSVNNAVIINPHIEKMQKGIALDSGNNANNQPPTNWSIIGGEIVNNNVSADNYSIHPGVFFNAVGGSQNGKIDGLKVYDNQTTKTQRFPVAFNGAFTWDNITINDNRLQADTANGGTSITLVGSAVLGSNVLIRDNQEFSGTNPNQYSSLGINRSVVSVSTSINAGSSVKNDYVYNVVATSTITLPTAVNNTNKYTITITNTGVTASIATTASQTINGSTTVVMNGQYLSYDFISDGSNWEIR